MPPHTLAIQYISVKHTPFLRMIIYSINVTTTSQSKLTELTPSQLSYRPTHRTGSVDPSEDEGNEFMSRQT